MKLTKVLLSLVGVWIVLNIALYAFVFPHPPRIDANCKTLQNGRVVSSRPCSKAEYFYKNILIAEGVLFGLAILSTVLIARGATPEKLVNRQANLSLIFGLVSIPAVILIGGGAVLAVFAILTGLSAMREAKSLGFPKGGRGIKTRSILGIIFSIIPLAFIVFYIIITAPHHGLANIILTLRSLPLPH